MISKPEEIIDSLDKLLKIIDSLDSDFDIEHYCNTKTNDYYINGWKLAISKVRKAIKELKIMLLISQIPIKTQLIDKETLEMLDESPLRDCGLWDSPHVTGGIVRFK